MSATSTKPYLIRAIYEWCVDQGSSPHLMVMVDEKVVVPPGYAQGGRIILDVSPEATHQLVLGNEDITFQARFGGVAHSLFIPVSHVLAVYAGENGHGMAFEPEDLPVSGEEGVQESIGDDDGDGPPAPDTPPAPAGGRPSHLKVVK